MQAPAGQRSTWERVRRLGALFVPERYRHCKLCGGKFLNGFMVVEQGYSTDAICYSCCHKGHSEELN